MEKVELRNAIAGNKIAVVINSATNKTAAAKWATKRIFKKIEERCTCAKCKAGAK